jgi:hypothetical protein
VSLPIREEYFSNRKNNLDSFDNVVCYSTIQLFPQHFCAPQYAEDRSRLLDGCMLDTIVDRTISKIKILLHEEQMRSSRPEATKLMMINPEYPMSLRQSVL